MAKPKQQALFNVGTVDSRFVKETLKRGGPYEVEGKRWRARKTQRQVGGYAIQPSVESMLPRLGKMR